MMDILGAGLGLLLFCVVLFVVFTSPAWGDMLIDTVANMSCSKQSQHGAGCAVNRDRSVQMNENVVSALEAMKSSGAFSAAQLRAFDTAIAVAQGEKWIEGAVYERVAPPGVATSGDKYVATSKLSDKDGDDRSFNLLNLTHRKGVPTREVYSPAKFRKIADSVSDILA